MTPLQELGAILALLYLSECVRVGGPFTVAVRSLVPGRWSLARAWRMAPQHVRSFVLAAPWPPLGGLLVVEELPFVAGPAGIAFRPVREEGWSLPDAAWTFVPWSQRARVKRDGTVFLVDGRPVARVGSRRAAASIAALLDRAAAGDPAKAVGDWLAQRHDAAGLETRLAEWSRASRALRVACNLLLVSVLGLVQVLVVTSDPRRWVVAFGVLVAAWAACVFLWPRAARVLPPELRPDTFRRVMQGLWPLGLVRATDELAVEVAGDFDADLVASRHLSKKALAAHLTQARRALACPLAGESEPAEALAQDEAWFRARAIERLDRLAKEHAIDLATDAVPARDGESASWCPRCLAQYAQSAVTCVSCRGVVLRPFEAPKAPLDAVTSSA